MEESYNHTHSNWHKRNSSKHLIGKTEECPFKFGISQALSVLRFATIVGKVLETCCHLISNDK